MKLVALYFFAVLTISWACFITNCPIGGKRSAAFGLQLYSNEYRRVNYFRSNICNRTKGTSDNSSSQDSLR